MIVTFCGHSNGYWNSEVVTDRLRSVIRDLIAEGADSFYLGGYGWFDGRAAEIVRDLKLEFPISVLFW